MGKLKTNSFNLGVNTGSNKRNGENVLTVTSRSHIKYVNSCGENSEMVFRRENIPKSRQHKTNRQTLLHSIVFVRRKEVRRRRATIHRHKHFAVLQLAFQSVERFHRVEMLQTTSLPFLLSVRSVVRSFYCCWDLIWILYALKRSRKLSPHFT